MMARLAPQNTTVVKMSVFLVKCHLLIKMDSNMIADIPKAIMDMIVVQSMCLKQSTCNKTCNNQSMIFEGIKLHIQDIH